MDQKKLRNGTLFTNYRWIIIYLNCRLQITNTLQQKEWLKPILAIRSKNIRENSICTKTFNLEKGA